jgi:hypothetical protein
MQHHRLAGAGELRVGAGDAGQAVEGSVAASEIAKIERIQGEFGVSVGREKDADDAIGLGVRERPQQNAITLKMALLAPMESARVSTMTMRKPGVRRRLRTA